MNKHGIRLITAVVTSSMIVTPVLAAPSVDDLKKEKAAKQNEVSSLQSQLTTLMGKVNTLESELIQTGEDITKAQSDLVVAQKKEKEQAVQQVSQTGASMSASDSELALLAAIIQCEAGGESHTGKVAVGAVIMNRVRSSQFPNSITEVVYQSGQFSPVASGILSSVLSQGARSDCYQAAQEALAGSNPIGSALYFNSGSGRGQQIGNQHFY